MSASRTSRRTLAAALGLAALAAGGCIEQVVVGTQPNSIVSPDAGEDASQDVLDAEPLPKPDAASPEPDAGTPPLDAALDDGGPIPIDAGMSVDAGCDAAGCIPEGGLLGPCFSCDVTISTTPMFNGRDGDICPNGLDELCWQNADETCSVQCPEAETCSASSDCAAYEYCYFPRGDCGVRGRGWCAPRPLGECEGVGNAVCGCDGTLYETGCHAVQIGVPVAGPGYEERCPALVQP